MVRAWIARAAAGLPLVLCLALDALAEGSFEDGVAAYKAKDYPAALTILRPLAEAGEAKAQAYVGAMHHRGEGVAADDEEAARWLQRAAEQGHAESQYSLAQLYALARIAPPADVDLGDGGAAQHLEAAVFWYRGGTPEGHAEAAKWFHRAAERGLAVAQFRLATMYTGGLAVPQDLVQAHKWYSLAAAGLPEGDGRTRLIAARDQLEAEMTEAQIAEAVALAEAWQPQAD